MQYCSLYTGREEILGEREKKKIKKNTKSKKKIRRIKKYAELFQNIGMEYPVAIHNQYKYKRKLNNALILPY